MSEEGVTLDMEPLRTGVVHISAHLIGELLRLPAGSKIVAANVDIWNRQVVQLLVEGPDMPEHPAAQIPPRVDLICRTEEVERGFVDPSGFVKRVTAWWSHNPAKTWVMKPWETVERVRY